METRRCPRCNKLLRADVEVCSRCGALLTTEKGRKKRLSGWLTDSTLMPSQPTSPPASPHRAGHYSGLHPEDQPFQSSFFLRVQRPLTTSDEEAANAEAFEDEAEDEEIFVPEQALEEEDELFLGPETPSWPAEDEEADFEEESGFVEEADFAEDADEDSRKLADRPTLPPYYPLTTASTILPKAVVPVRPTAPKPGLRLVPTLIVGSVILFLLASSLLVFLLIGRGQAAQSGPQLMATPGELRVGDILQLSGNGFSAQSGIALTRDGQVALLDEQGATLEVTTDARGSFKTHVPVTSAWEVGTHSLQATDSNQHSSSASVTISTPASGPARLQLGSSRLDLGAGNPASVSEKNMTLTNAGGGEVTWSAKSQVDWLSLNPGSGTFAGSAVVALKVNRANLAPQAYLGQVIFTQEKGTTQTLYVSMTVNTTPASLVLSTASLAFSGTPAQSPAGQTMTIQNSGGQALNWTAGRTTSDSLDWLSVSPASGLLPAHTSAVLTVEVNSLKMAEGTYQGALSFSYAGGSPQEVAVTLTVNPPPLPVISVDPANLNFSTNQGYNPDPQKFTIANTGNALLNWSLQGDANAALFLRLDHTKGSLEAGQSTTITVSPTIGSASGPINGTLTVIDSDQNTTVASVPIKVSIAVTSQPVISVFTGNMEFDHTATFTDEGILAIFANTGDLPLNWSIAASPQVSWLSFDVSSGTLAPGDFGFVTVYCRSAGVKAGTYTVTLTIKDTAAHTVAAPRSFTVTLKVSA